MLQAHSFYCQLLAAKFDLLHELRNMEATSQTATLYYALNNLCVPLCFVHYINI
ncbi:hypothetical protein VAE308_1280057 [Vibrio aestuarianus]|uniref:Uncharacterized protein n=1 Tax=Vibrio aestuarianus TaxID=28171 RepID=A0ABM9FJP1_9VIBR|nr:hypothetical protein VAE063_1010396 [Vibrio aestuarianus]CAH8227043.1 hypothetical protein VAE308_1280057 [Vibrio aestuarianus]